MRTLRDPKRKPTHPGAVLREDVLPALRMTQTELARRPESWLRMQEALDVWKVHQHPEKLAALQSIKPLGWMGFAKHISAPGIRLQLLACIGLALLCQRSQAADAGDPAGSLMATHSLICTFPQGSSTDWSQGQPKLQPNSGLQSPLYFDQIDLQRGTARIIGNTAAADIRVLGSAGGMTFIETTGLGGFITTTVFTWFRSAKTQEFVAVHSHHITGLLSLDPPIPSQYHGTCKTLDPPILR